MSSPKLRCDALFFAEYARFSQGGALNAFSIFDQMSAPQFPAHSPEFSVCAKLGGPAHMRGRPFQVYCGIVAPAGHSVSRRESRGILGGHPTAPTATAWIVLPFAPVSLDGPGLYSVILQAGDLGTWTTVFPVVLRPDGGWRP